MEKALQFPTAVTLKDLEAVEGDFEGILYLRKQRYQFDTCPFLIFIYLFFFILFSALEPRTRSQFGPICRS